MNRTHDSTDGLQLGTVTDPAHPDRSIAFFSDWKLAWEHLRDHLLTAPECLAWRLVSPAYLHILNPEDGDARWTYAQQATASQGQTAQPLYDLYRTAVSQDTADATLLGWHQDGDRVTVCLGTSGVLVLFGQRVVLTAFLPGHGSEDATRAARQADSAADLPRERGMRSGRNGRRDRETVDREQRLLEQRQAAWSPAERLYHRVFKPSVQFVKRCQHRHRDLYGRLIRGDYALLKDVLPPLSQLKYENWITLRQRCGRTEPTLRASTQASE